MAAYFSGTITALKKGITKMTAAAAVRNIENWEESLQNVEVTGCRAILRDLGALKKQLQEDEPDGERIRHLVARLAGQTIAIAEKADARYSEKIAKLGEMLADAAESAESEDALEKESAKSKPKSKSDKDDDHDDDGRFVEGNHAGQTSSSKSGSARSYSSSTARESGASDRRGDMSENARGGSRSARSR
jgi:hypothetical protein